MRSLHSQSGAATLVISLILLVAMTLITLFTARSMVMEQRISANDYRSKQSFGAAEAGIQQAISMMTDIRVKNIYDVSGTLQYDSNDDDSPDTNLVIGSTTLGNGASYSATFSALNAGVTDEIVVTSTGFSDDGTAQKTITVLAAWGAAAPNPPPASLVATSNVNLSGSVNVSNVNTNLTIWSGGTTALTGAATTTTNDPVVAGVAQNDGALAGASGDELFETFFHSTKADIEAMADPHYVGAGNYSSTLDGMEDKIIWVDAAAGEFGLNSNTTIGSASDPVILIVENLSDFGINGNVTIWGIVYVMGDYIKNGGGNLTINGALVVEGTVTGNGNPTINFFPAGMTLPDVGLGTFQQVPGTWRDF